jgi:hypothetical protein
MLASSHESLPVLYFAKNVVEPGRSRRRLTQWAQPASGENRMSVDCGLIDQVEQLTTTFPRNAEVRDIAKEVQRHPRLCAFHAQQRIPRYLEARL